MEVAKLRYILQKIKTLSFLAMGRTSPNPPVAAVITDEAGNILATGNTQITGLDHAERAAYKDLDTKIAENHDLISESIETHQLYVTLEPCTHFGKTPPCRDLVIEKKPRQIFLGWRDPNPLVASSEWKVYEENGIDIKLHPLLAQGSFPFLHGFFQRVNKKRPWVWVKSAITSDGFYAPLEKQRFQISSKASQYYLQMLRAKFDAIVVGPNTIAVDDPGLDFRLEESDFKTRGDVSIIESPSVSEFFSAGEQFLDSIFRESTIDIAKEHIANVISYQPWRVFILNKNVKISKAFIDKQNGLNEKYGKKLCLFYFLLDHEQIDFDPSSVFHELRGLTDSPFVSLSPRDSDLFFHDLANHGINTVLLEAGSFLWEFVHENLDSLDCILTIQSKKEGKEGRKFQGLDQFEKQIRYQVGKDTWQLEMKT